MCGIAGYFHHPVPETSAERILSMVRSLRHRGPDDEGFAFIDTRHGRLANAAGRESDAHVQGQLPLVEDLESVLPHDLALGHRRFSIVDLTAAGHQPMWHREAKVCAAFNGEIYNYVELREELERHGHRFETRSDTEVLLNAYLRWGTDALRRFNGPLALALYDGEKGRLLLARDRIGKVPLYHAVRDGCLYWCSEIKGILAACGDDGFSIREQAIDDYVVHGLRDLNGTFWEGIEDFPVASFAWIEPDLSFRPESYWSLPRRRRRASEISVDEASRELEEILWDATRLRMRADAPVAFELSGGMDSSALVALAATRSRQRFPTYTVEFGEKHANEEPFARAVAERYAGSVDYHVIRPGRDDFWRAADDFVALQEEPFHAPNLVTSQDLKRRIGRDGVRVVLAGSGGDEVLAGYPGEYLAPFLVYLWRDRQYARLVREAFGNSEVSALRLARAAVRKGVRRLWGRRPPESGSSLLSIYRRPCGLSPIAARSDDFSERMRQNMTSRLMNYWLRSGNKTTMGIPIEPRTPFLDHRLVDLVFSLPPEYLIRDGWHKWLLRHATEEILPRAVVRRRVKAGFPFPWKEWLRHSRQAVEDNLSDVESPYFRAADLMRHYGGLIERDPVGLWRLISLGLWWRRVVERRRIVAPRHAAVEAMPVA